MSVADPPIFQEKRERKKEKKEKRKGKERNEQERRTEKNKYSVKSKGRCLKSGKMPT